MRIRFFQVEDQRGHAVFFGDLSEEAACRSAMEGDSTRWECRAREVERRALEEGGEVVPLGRWSRWIGR